MPLTKCRGFFCIFFRQSGFKIMLISQQGLHKSKNYANFAPLGICGTFYAH